ncbi:unnamed protein product [Lactuca saligna]|uniref:Uncharacterized protein n=1 Tax=Lactuca saligna TaxID=75948 RepID=A0AA35Z5D0_LACSI|nr:unnamed protein product [Lactuca saligna]
MEGAILARDLGSDDFELSVYDDSFTDNGIEGSNFVVDDEESDSSVRVHESYDDNDVRHTPNIAIVPVLKTDRGSVASAALVVVLSGGEASSGGRVMKRSRSLDPCTFQSFSHSLGISHRPSYIQQLNFANSPHDVDAPYPPGPVYLPPYEYRLD